MTPVSLTVAPTILTNRRFSAGQRYDRGGLCSLPPVGGCGDYGRHSPQPARKSWGQRAESARRLRLSMWNLLKGTLMIHQETDAEMRARWARENKELRALLAKQRAEALAEKAAKAKTPSAVKAAEAAAARAAELAARAAAVSA